MVKKIILTLGSLLTLQIPIMSQASNLVHFSTILPAMVFAIMLISNLVSQSAGNMVD